MALGIFGALTKLKSAANDLPYTSQVVLGLFGQCNAQASKVAHCIHHLNSTQELPTLTAFVKVEHTKIIALEYPLYLFKAQRS